MQGLEGCLTESGISARHSAWSVITGNKARHTVLRCVWYRKEADWVSGPGGTLQSRMEGRWRYLSVVISTGHPALGSGLL